MVKISHRRLNTASGASLILISLLVLVILPAAYSAPPVISGEFPSGGSINNFLDTNLTATIQDPEAGLMNITISFYNSSLSSWQIIRSTNNTNTGTFNTVNPFYLKAKTNYLWRITARDSEENLVEKTLNFTTGGGLLTLKFNTNMGGANGTQVFPVMGDVDGDGTQEIVMDVQNRLVVVNGKTGQIEWTLAGGLGNGVELSDLDNDGTPEILQAIPGPKLRAVNGDGTVRWTTAKLTGDGQSLYPVTSYDIDGDGYPEIYFASEDTYPTIYTGSKDDYDGALNMIDHNGNVLRTQWLYHPCWGGMAIGDVNFDGTFEIYVSDRRYGYNNVPANGIQAFNAHTLEPLWERPEFQHSSPMPVISDITGDKDLEVIATMITHKGPSVLNGMTGDIIFDYTNKGLPTHGTPTVYDIDKDGNKEILYATSYPSTSAPEFAVFDLIEGKTEFRPVLENQVSWPPKIGNIDTNSDMEILATTGKQGWQIGNYPLLVYNKDFRLIDRVDPSGTGQMMPAVVSDSDGDGLNEVIVATANGRLLVYDTKAPTPNPAPRTWYQFYSEYRQGVAEYVEPAGPDFPTLASINPKEGSVNISLYPAISVRANDYQKDLMDLKFEVYSGFIWQTVATYNDVGNGIYSSSTAGFVTDYNTNYKWRVTATDSHGNSHQETFSFTTRLPPPVTTKPLISNEDPVFNAKAVPTSTATLRFNLSDGDGDLMNYTVNTIPNVGSANAANVGNGIYTVPVSGLQPNREYIWQITVKDPKNVSYKELRFTTPYILVQNVQGSGNILTSPQPPFGYMANVQLIANASSTSEFIGWTGNLTLGDNPESLVMDSQKNVTARFRQKTDDLIQDPGFDESADSQDLIYDGSWQDWYESRHDKQELATISSESIGGNAGKKLKIDEFYARNVIISQEFKQMITDNFNIKWDVYVSSIMDNNGADDRAAIMMIGNNNPYSASGPNSGGSRNFAWLAFSKIGGGNSGLMNLTIIDREGNETVIAQGLQLKQWYTIRVAGNITSDSYDVYVNGVLKGQNISSRALKSNVTHISFSQGGDGYSTFYIDNVMESTSDTITCADSDGDGYNSTLVGCGPVDCNDANSLVHPGASEVCDGVDNDCNAGTADGSGQIAPNATLQSGVCSGSKKICSSGAWNDNFVAIPDYEATETTCDSLDNDCDSAVDEGGICVVSSDGWSYRKMVVINHTKVDADMAGFPVLVSIDDINLKNNAQADGDDIYFTSADGLTKINHEIERYNNGNLVAWVRADVSSVTDTVIYMYYGNPAAVSQQNKAGVWDSSFLSVHHLEEKTGNALDSTGIFNGTPLNGVNQTESGKLNGAYGFDGVNDRVQLPRVFNSETQFTIEGWMNTGNKQGYAFSQRDTASHGTLIQYFTDGSVQLYVNGMNIKKSGNLNEWHHVVATFDGTTAKLYVDAGTPVQGTSTLSWPNVATFFGDRTQGDRQFLGKLDEMRLSNVARSEAYIHTSFNNQDSPSTFYALGIQEALVGVTCEDNDNDNYNSTGGTCGPIDCDDSNAAVHPGASDICNGLNDDCNAGTADGSGQSAPLSTLQAGVCSGSVKSCIAGSWTNNYAAISNYEAAETSCDSLDNDCDSSVDEGGVCVVSSWAYRKNITLNHNMIDEDMTGFPVMIALDDADLAAKAQSDGDDIYFTAEDGVTKLDHELERYNNGNLVAWVRADVSSVTDTVIYMYYGNPAAASQQNKAGVWDSSFLSVHHLEEKTGNAIDSTGRFNGTPLNGVNQSESGKLNGAYGFDGVNDRVQLPRVFNSETQFTIEGWMNTGNKQGYAFSQRDTASHGTLIQYFTDGSVQLYVNGMNIKKAGNLNEWHHVVATFDGTTAKLYVDAGVPVQGTSTLSWPNVATFFGDRTQGDRQFLGKLDEMRLSNVARSEAYIHTSFNNQDSPSTFYVVDGEETI